MNQDRPSVQPTATPIGAMIRQLFARRWLIVASLVTGWVIGTAISWILSPRYRSETVILVEQQKVPEHYVESNITTDLQQRLQSMSEQILSRTRLLALIDKFNLYGGNASRADQDALVDLMRKDIKIEMISAGGRPDQLSAFKVSYSAAKPQLARDVTQELTTLFINENLQNREQLSEDTTAFLQSQLDEARQSLAEQEERLRQFRAQHAGELPEQMQGNLQILGGLQIQLQAATDSLSQAEQHNLYLRSLLNQYQGSRPGTNVVEGGATPTFKPQAQLTALRAQLAELQGRYTDKYPDIIRIQQEIAEREAQQAKEGASATQAGAAEREAAALNQETEESSSVIQLRSELSANEFQIRNERAKIKRLEQLIETYHSRLNLTPERQQQATAVTRDYDQSRSYYEALLSKKLQSEMATNLEKRRQGEQFRMIDPPNLPSRPYFPKRLACSLGGLAAGLALGLGIAMMLELLVPRLHEESELSEFVGSGYVLALPAFETEQERARAHKRRVLEGVAAGMLAVVIPGITVLSQLKH